MCIIMVFRTLTAVREGYWIICGHEEVIRCFGNGAAAAGVAYGLPSTNNTLSDYLFKRWAMV